MFYGHSGIYPGVSPLVQVTLVFAFKFGDQPHVPLAPYGESLALNEDKLSSRVVLGMALNADSGIG